MNPVVCADIECDHSRFEQLDQPQLRSRLPAAEYRTNSIVGKDAVAETPGRTKAYRGNTSHAVKRAPEYCSSDTLHHVGLHALLRGACGSVVNAVEEILE